LEEAKTNQKSLGGHYKAYNYYPTYSPRLHVLLTFFPDSQNFFSFITETLFLTKVA